MGSGFGQVGKSGPSRGSWFWASREEWAWALWGLACGCVCMSFVTVTVFYYPFLAKHLVASSYNEAEIATSRTKKLCFLSRKFVYRGL